MSLSVILVLDPSLKQNAAPVFFLHSYWHHRIRALTFPIMCNTYTLKAMHISFKTKVVDELNVNLLFASFADLQHDLCPNKVVRHGCGFP